MEPGVKEHRAVAGREDKAVAVGPAGFVGVVRQQVAVKHGTNFSAAQGQAEVAGGAFVHGVDGKATGLGGSLGKDLGLKFHNEMERRLNFHLRRPFPACKAQISGTKKAGRKARFEMVCRKAQALAVVASS
jgi:hypothetical protein